MKQTVFQRITNLFRNQAPPLPQRLVVQRVAKRQLKTYDIGDLKSAISAYELGRVAPLQMMYEELSHDPIWQMAVAHRKEASQVFDVMVTIPGSEPKEYDKKDKVLAFVFDAMDALFYGWQTFEVTNWYSLTYNVLPRTHVDPVKKVFLPDAYGSEKIPIADNPDVILLVDGLGTIYSAARYLIYKMNAMGDFAQFAELYGTPVEEITYTGNDPQEKARIEQMLEEGGSAMRRMLPANTEVRYHNAAGSVNVDVYTRLLDYCDQQVTKLVLGQTMTSNDGSSYAQAKVHLQIEETILQSDTRWLEGVLNRYLAPKLLQPGERFQLVMSAPVTLEKLAQQVEVDTKLAELVQKFPELKEKYASWLR